MLVACFIVPRKKGAIHGGRGGQKQEEEGETKEDCGQSASQKGIDA